MMQISTRDFITSLPEYDNHRLVLLINDNKTNLHGYIAIHRLNNKHPSFGATRYWPYSSERNALKDALRLSKTMSYKAALAGLPGGGAKAVLIAGTSGTDKNVILKEYAREVSYLSGIFITGSDVGLIREDVKYMKRICPYFVGTKVSPEKFTAFGLFESIKVCLKHVYGNESFEGKSFAVQGVGKVGSGILELLYKESRNIFVSDIDNNRLKFIKSKFPGVTIVDPAEIHKMKVNVYAPCALSNCINFKNVGELNCEIIVGGANNQLESRRLSNIIHKMSILYAPDYVVNAGGLISVYDEYENKNVRIKRINDKVKHIGNVMNKILTESKRRDKSPLEVADEMAELIFNNHF